ncbi:MAG TPA: PadR family transcriptional regulator [Dermatophilaceae bacterium]|nr:PadR family transcriptional regulator [Dermatophilaceae bacterium]
MSPVFAHGQMRLYLLALLEEGPRHGYEVMRALEERFNGLYSPSAGTVYPRLAKLEEEGLVERSDEGRKATYRITEAGRAEVRARAYDVADLQQDLDHSVRELAQEVRSRVHGSAQDLRAELKEAAKQARANATPAGTAYQPRWSPEPPKDRRRPGADQPELEAAVNAFRFEVRDAVRRLRFDEERRQEVMDIVADAAERIRDVLRRP